MGLVRRVSRLESNLLEDMKDVVWLMLKGEFQSDTSNRRGAYEHFQGTSNKLSKLDKYMRERAETRHHQRETQMSDGSTKQPRSRRVTVPG